MKNLSILILSSFVFLFAACDRPECKNTNPIFDSNGIETNIYKKELIKEIERIGKENLTYWLSEYSERNGQEYITVHIQGAELCAKGTISVTEWKNMSGIKKTKGKSYHGAELQDLNFDIIYEGESITFVFKSLGAIID